MENDSMWLLSFDSTDDTEPTEIWLKQRLSFIPMITWFLYTRILWKSLKKPLNVYKDPMGAHIIWDLNTQL